MVGTMANCASKALPFYKQEPPHARVRRLREYPDSDAAVLAAAGAPEPRRLPEAASL